MTKILKPTNFYELIEESDEEVYIMLEEDVEETEIPDEEDLEEKDEDDDDIEEETIYAPFGPNGPVIRYRTYTLADAAED